MNHIIVKNITNMSYELEVKLSFNASFVELVIIHLSEIYHL